MAVCQKVGVRKGKHTWAPGDALFQSSVDWTKAPDSVIVSLYCLLGN